VNIGAIQGSVPSAPLDAPDWAIDASGVGKTAPAGAEFGHLISDGLSQVNEQLGASQVDLQRLATGDVQNLHQVMMNLEETRLSFQLLMQVRNRLLEAYQDVMKMQI
jgi:flagellar hook-basal body complex protein FliE